MADDKCCLYRKLFNWSVHDYISGRVSFATFFTANCKS